MTNPLWVKPSWEAEQGFLSKCWKAHNVQILYFKYERRSWGGSVAAFFLPTNWQDLSCTFYYGRLHLKHCRIERQPASNHLQSVLVGFLCVAAWEERGREMIREADVGKGKTYYTAVHTVDERQEEKVRERGFSEAECGVGESRGKCDGLNKAVRGVRSAWISSSERGEERGGRSQQSGRKESSISNCKMFRVLTAGAFVLR